MLEEIEQKIRLDESKTQDVAETLETVCNTNTATKEELIHNLIGKGEFKTELINVADEMFLQKEKEVDESNEVMENYEN